MALTACSAPHSRICLRLSLCLLFSFSFAFTAYAQTATYHLHREASSTANLFQLKTAGPDAASLAVQSVNLKNQPVGEYLIKAFDTQSGVPNASGVIPAGSTVTFVVWMKKTANQGAMVPRVKLYLNSAAGTSVCVVTGPTALSTTLTKYTLTGTVSSNVSVTTTDRFYFWVGVNVTSSPNQNNQAELDVEGTLNGNYDSLITVPLPTAAPSISGLTPNIGAVGTPITVAGTNFGATQGTSTIKFNGITATPTSWSATSIAVPVPSGATTGTVVVTANGQTSTGVAFTVTPSITSLTPNSGPVGTAVTVSGSAFGATQGTSTITFNGTPASPSSWSAAAILTSVPAGATTGPVVATVAGQPSNGVTFAVTETGAIGGTITRSSNGATIGGALVEALQGSVVKASTTTAANGSYAISNVNVGTYDVRVSASGYQTGVQNGVVVTANATTTVNQSLDAVPPGDIDYIYDELGRLIAVVTTTETAIYTYDAVGNLLSIARGNSAQVSIIEFTPNSGGIGAEVRIFGTAFSTTPSQNAVTFNGVAANVTSASSREIVTNVPAGAITGPISVTTPSGTATSITSFMVGTPGAPTVTSFTPTIGAAGTSVSITGTNFEPNLYNNKPEFNQSLASTTSATATNIATSVPLMASSGRISVRTPAGIGVSSGDFVVPPSPYAPADVEVTSRMSIGEDKLVTLTQANKIAIILFDGIAGQRVSLGMSGVTFGAPNCCDTASIVIYKPNGVLVAPFGFGPAGNGTATQVLPVTGTYSILVDPYGANTGHVTLSLFEDLAATISINGPPLTLNITRVGQNARLTFAGTAGQRVSLGIGAVTIGAPNYYDVGSVAIYRPDGTAMFMPPMGFGTAGNGTATQVLPVTGNYSITVDPYYANTGNATFTLSEDLANQITINGPPQMLTFKTGQNARLTFDGTAGQRVSVGISAVTIGAPNYYDVGSVAIYKPDGTAMFTALGFGTAGNGTATQVLPVTGTYYIVVDPYGGNAGNGTVTLSEDLANPITSTDPPLTLTFRAGQNARLPFEGTAGQQVTVGISAVTIGAPNYYDVGSVAIYKPDGTAMFTPLGFGTAGNGTATQTLPVTGTYYIVVDPYVANAGNGTVTLSEDIAIPITINGPPLMLTFKSGQNARLTFDGTAGQRVSVGISAVTIGAPNYYDVGSVAIYKPDGTAMFTPLGFGTGGNGTATQVLPVTGTYSIVVNPYGANAGNGTVTLSEDLANPVSATDPPLTLTFRAGQNARLPVEGTAGQRVSVGISAVTIGAPNYYDVGSVAIYKPDGTPMFTALGFGTGGNGIASQVLPVSGTYYIVIDPFYAYAGNGTVTLSEDLVDPITINGPSLTLNFKAGQNARLPFEGTAGQRVSVGISTVTIGAPNYYDVGSVTIYKPDGTVMFTPVGFSTAGNGTASQVLPVTGTYYVAVDPYYAYAGNGTVTLSEDLQNSVSSTGPPLTLTFRSGQNARLTFEGTAGQQVSVGISAVTIGAPNSYDVGSFSIYKPDGTVLVSPFGFGTAGSNSASQVLPTTGTYSIIVDPYLGYAGNLTLTLSEDLYSTIAINGAPVTLQFTRVGQNARLSFSGNAGQWVSVGMSDTTISAVNCCSTSTVAIYKPDGTTLLAPFGFYQVGGGTPSVLLPATGTYSILVDPYASMVGNVTITLSEDLSPPISINGPAVILTNRVGQNGRLLFSGSAGQWVSIGASDTTIGAVNCCTTSTVAIYKPDGTALLTPYPFYQAGAGTPSVLLPTSGTYSILVDPYYAVAGNVTITLSEDLSPPISINGPAVILTNRAGQNGRLLFSGSAGQWVSVGASDTTIGAVNCCTTSTVAIYKPDGTTLLTPYPFYQAGAGTPSVLLPTSGTYSIIVDPYNAVAGNVTITLSEDLSPPISINGPAVILTNRAGQNGRLLFSGTAGQRVSVGAGDTTIGAVNCCTTSSVAIYKPDGTTLVAPYPFYQAGAGTPSALLPTTGTYSIVVDPYNAVAGNVTITLSEDLSPPISINGPAVVLTNRAGQNARMSFSGNAGQWISLGVSDTTIGAANCCTTSSVAIYKPDGTALLAPLGFYQAGVATASMQLPTTGTYSLVIDPYNAVAGNVTLTLSEDLASTVTINGSSLPLTFRVGQNASISFDGSAGQQATVRVTSNSIGSVTVKLLKPDGTQLTSATSSSSSFNLTGQTLPTTGTYKIVIDPTNPNSGTLSIAVTSP